VEFDGYMRELVDREVFLKGKNRFLVQCWFILQDTMLKITTCFLQVSLYRPCLNFVVRFAYRWFSQFHLEENTVVYLYSSVLLRVLSTQLCCIPFQHMCRYECSTIYSFISYIGFMSTYSAQMYNRESCFSLCSMLWIMDLPRSNSSSYNLLLSLITQGFQNLKI
jgi:hypothetical protein